MRGENNVNNKKYKKIIRTSRSQPFGVADPRPGQKGRGGEKKHENKYRPGEIIIKNNDRLQPVGTWYLYAGRSPTRVRTVYCCVSPSEG